MKVVIAKFSQESNSFSAINGDLESFRMGGITMGAEMITGGHATEVDAFVDVLREAGADIVPTIAMRSLNSCGKVEREVYDHFWKHFSDAVKAALPVDGVFLGFHGATQITDDDDGIGLFAQSIRELIGDDAVLSISTDYHANITKKAIKYADYICGFQTYPHIDIYETGHRAATLGVMSLKNGRRFPMAHIKLPMLLQAEASQTTEYPMRAVFEHARALCEASGALDFSVYQMQPWLDAYEGGSTVLAVARDAKTAKEVCEGIARKYWDVRGDITYTLADMDEVLDIAVGNKSGKPVIMSDSADSPSAGSTGDSTAVLSRLLERKIDIPSILTIVDPDVPRLAERLGVGNTGEFDIGGKIDRTFFKTICIKAYVKAIFDGKFVITGKVNSGAKRDVGRTAVLQCGAITIVCCERPTANYDPVIFTAFGVDPAQARLVVAKSATQYRAHYACYSDLMYTIDTPGAASANLRSFEFKHLPHPIYPFDDISDYAPGEPTLARGQ